MTEPTEATNDNRQDPLLIGYILQWSSLLFPPLLLVSLVYLLVVRSRIVEAWQIGHLRWQLMTCYIVIAGVVLALILLFVGMSGIGTDAPLSIAATFVLVGAGYLFPFWYLYRCIRGTLHYAKRRPLEGPYWL
jgi:uncharacterized membrane protein